MAEKYQVDTLKKMLKIVDEWNYTCPENINKDWNCIDCWSLFPKSKCEYFSKDGYCEISWEKCLYRRLSQRQCQRLCPCPCEAYNKKDLIQKVKNYINEEE